MSRGKDVYAYVALTEDELRDVISGIVRLKESVRAQQDAPGSSQAEKDFYLKREEELADLQNKLEEPFREDTSQDAHSEEDI